MFIVNSYLLAVVLCVVTMICWGSWGNTQKLAARSWRYELYYWDYVIGILFFSVLMGLTLGSIGSEGRSFVPDLCQVSGAAIVSAIIGGIIFNASNILLTASVSLAGMSVAFPVGVGLALVLGVIINYFGQPKGDATLLFTGVSLIVVAIIVNGLASGRQQRGAGSTNRKGIVLAILAPIAASLIQMAISRSREYLADETGARLCGQPLALAGALHKLSGASGALPLRSGNACTEQMFIVKPVFGFGGSMNNLFSTHPPIEERIQRLVDMNRTGQFR